MNDYADQQLNYRALENLLSTLAAARRGDFNARMPANGDGFEREVADALNELLTAHSYVTGELERVAQSVAQGELSVEASLGKAKGAWILQLRAVNEIVSLFARHTADVRTVVKAVHAGDLGAQLAIGPETTHRGGDLQRLGEAVNAMVSHVEHVTTEIARASAEVGLEGRLTRQCLIGEVSGAWGLLIANFNGMTKALSEQIQDLSQTAHALAAGNLAARATGNTHGDLQALKLSLNSAADGMAGLCSELRRVAQEVSQEGKLAIELRQPDPRGDFQGVQEACNRTIGTLVKTLRSITQAASNLVAGNYTLELDAHTPGELGAPIQQLLRLAEGERRTQHGLESLLYGRFHEVKAGGGKRDDGVFMLGVRLKHEWFNAARVGILQAREQSKDVDSFLSAALICVAQTAGATVGACHVLKDGEHLVQVSNLGCSVDASATPAVRIGQGLVGKAALDGKPMLLDDLEASGIRIRSSLLEVVPRAVLIFPIRDELRVVAVLELGFMNEGASTALELLECLNADLSAGVGNAKVQQTGATGWVGERAAALEEELVIATTRLEHVTRELQQRDQLLRELQQETRALRAELQARPDPTRLAEAG
jgi:HAMP domain-containing protein